MYEENEIERIRKEIYKDMEERKEREEREAEFSKSWIGRKKMKVKNAREKQSFLKWSRM